MHMACDFGLERLVDALLEKGANPNLQTSRLTNNESPMHRAILKSHEHLLDLFIKHKEAPSKLKSNSSRMEIPDFNLKDSDGQSILSLCLWNSLFDYAQKLISN